MLSPSQVCPHCVVAYARLAFLGKPAFRVARDCPATWFSFTSGVFPMLRELSSNLIDFAFVFIVYKYYIPIIDRQYGDRGPGVRDIRVDERGPLAQRGLSERRSEEHTSELQS